MSRQGILTTQAAAASAGAERQLADGERLQRSVLDVLDEGVIVVDARGALLQANRAACTILDLDVDAARADPAWWRKVASGPAGRDSPCAAVLHGGRAISDDAVEARRPDGTRVRLAVNYAPLHDESGAVEGMVISVRDVTRRREEAGNMATQSALLDEVDVAVVATDPEGHVTHWNKGAERLYGWSRDEALGRATGELLAVPETRAGEVVAELRRVGHWEGERTVAHKDGSTFTAYLRGRVMLGGAGEPAGWTGIAVDMSERLESERALRASSNYLRAVADSVGEGLFTLDTDGCLTYMNAAAEGLLGWSQAELQGRAMHAVAHTRRIDGSELAAADSPILSAVRDGTSRRIEDDVFIRRDGRELPVSYTAAPFETSDGVHGCVVVFEDITERKTREQTLQRDVVKLGWIGRIQDALADDRFVLYAQPIVDLRSGAVVQRELLLRMREPDGQIVGPSEYLSIAEQYGLVGDIDRWVIRRAAQLAAAGDPVEINLSARSIGDQSVLDHIERCIAESGADPTLLVFEITETALIADESSARAFAEHLHSLGCKLALDDFGTGYGGFTYLKQLPLDFLKIDIEFVRDLATNPASCHVVQAVVALARGFKLQTVAEGVEDAETYELLREFGVDFAQGYHIARPTPLDAAVIDGRDRA